MLIRKFIFIFMLVAGISSLSLAQDLGGNLTKSKVTQAPSRGNPFSVNNKNKYKQDEIILALTENVTIPLEVILKSGMSFKAAGADEELDDLFNKFKISFKDVEPLFREAELVQTKGNGARSYTTTTIKLLKEREQNKRNQILKKSLLKSKSNVSSAPIGLYHVYKIHLNSSALDPQKVASAFSKKSKFVRYAETVDVYQSSFEPNDPYYQSIDPYINLWGLKNVHANDAWDLTMGQGVTVAVVDSGVDYIHRDIQDNIWHNPAEIAGNNSDDDQNGYVDDVMGWNFVDNDHNLMDGSGHGTHVAGIIAATGNNNLGIIGMAPKAKIMIIKSLDSTGRGYSRALAQGIVYAAHNGADVINNSWGCSDHCKESNVIKDAIDEAYSLNKVVVFAAGNSNDDVFYYSKGNPKTITVSAIDQNDQKAEFSNYGWLIDVASPGVDILSLNAQQGKNTISNQVPPSQIIGENKEYLILSGTSMAAPYVSGLSALIISNRLSHNQTLSPDQVKQIIRLSAFDVDQEGFDRNTGAGRIDAAKAMQTMPRLFAQITFPKYAQSLTFNNLDLSVLGTAEGEDFNNYDVQICSSESFDQCSFLVSGNIESIHNALLATIPFSDDLSTYSQKLLKLAVSDSKGNKYYDAKLFNIDPPEPKEIQRLTFTDDKEEQFPLIVGNYVLYSVEGYPRNDLMLMDLRTKTTQLVGQVENGYHTYKNYCFDGHYIAYLDNQNIKLYDIFSRKTLTVGHVSGNIFISLSGNKIAWVSLYESFFYSFKNYSDLYIYDIKLNQTTQFPLKEFGPEDLVLRNGRILFRENYDNPYGRIAAFDIKPIKPGLFPDRIFWRKNINIDYKDLKTLGYVDNNHRITPLLNSITNLDDFHLSATNNPNKEDIFRILKAAYHITELTPDAGSDSPDISEEYMVWDKVHHIGDDYAWIADICLAPVSYRGTIYGDENSHCFILPRTTNSRMLPKISKDGIVWIEQRSAQDFNIFYLDLPTNKITQITTDANTQGFPSIDENRIVWEDKRGGISDIYYYEVPVQNRKGDAIRIQGKILDQNTHQPVDEYLVVSLYDDSMSTKLLETTTNDDSDFEFRGLEEGWYNLEIKPKYDSCPVCLHGSMIKRIKIYKNKKYTFLLALRPQQ